MSQTMIFAFFYKGHYYYHDGSYTLLETYQVFYYDHSVQWQSYSYLSCLAWSSTLQKGGY
jgi:hypothetical protein